MDVHGPICLYLFKCQCNVLLQLTYESSDNIHINNPYYVKKRHYKNSALNMFETLTTIHTDQTPLTGMRMYDSRHDNTN